jgi:hypothetical protein
MTTGRSADGEGGGEGEARKAQRSSKRRHLWESFPQVEKAKEEEARQR